MIQKKFSVDNLEPLSAEEQAVLAAIDPVNERLYARTPSNASPARADTPIPDFNANNDGTEEADVENELDNIDEKEPDTMVSDSKFYVCVDRFHLVLECGARIMQIKFIKPFSTLLLQQLQTS